MGESIDINIDFSTLSQLNKCSPVYDSIADTFFISSEKPVSAVSLDWDGEFWLRVTSKGEIVGLEIEHFESVFVKKNPGMAKVWREAKPYCLKRQKQYHTLRDKRTSEVCDSFIRIMIQFLANMFRNNPYQASLGIVQ